MTDSEEQYCDAYPCLNELEPVTAANSMRVRPVDRGGSAASDFTAPVPLGHETLTIHIPCFNPQIHSPVR